ncbi:MAG: RecQ family ATP-dependent DNA helicase [Gallionella sp.]|nr:RecQ family ATP-dependent DNA helicase [Gallionella sp.]
MSEKKIFAPRCLCLDLEVEPGSRRILKIGALRPDTKAFLHFKGNFHLASALAELDLMAAGAGFILGHNVIRHDLNLLRAQAPQLKLLDFPVVDTLVLSPLAFARNPYHHLVKDYRLLRLSVNDPLADAQRTVELFAAQRDALKQTPTALLRAYHYLLVEAGSGSGLNNFFMTLTHAPRPDKGAVIAIIEQIMTPLVCRTRLIRLLSRDLDDALMHPAIAYVLAWLRVAAERSVMPTWVLLEHPKIVTLVRELRTTPCKDQACLWCRDHHDPRVWLKRWFNHDDFRREAGGSSLQENIVSAAISERSLLGILPTGGGKSLCYQLPALMRYAQTGALTIVISPLQALMKDQVDTLLRRGVTAAATLNGSLSYPERRQVFDGIRQGDVGILLVSPEQLRNKGFKEAIKYREIAAWVFDEAHCLSRWGQDFRPDYLYVSRFMRELHGAFTPPVICLTATARQNVIDDIAEHFRRRLDIELEFHLGSTGRDNLSFDVVPVRGESKLPQIHRLLADQFGEPAEDEPAEHQGGAIVYCSTRKNTETVADYLAMMGWQVAAYHAGLTPDVKKARQQDFIAGRLKLMTATNAFGMGIDKPDVRLVVHADIPASLENYIQEAGRAGRDQASARCVLFYDERDAERQFGMTLNSRLTPKDIQNLLHALRRRPADKAGNVVLTEGELLATENLELDFDPGDRDRKTRVKTAVAWLENAALLERNENRTQVFPASVKFTHLDEAQQKLAQSAYSDKRRGQLLELLRALLQADPGEGLTTDDLALAAGLPAMEVGRALHDLETLGLLENDSRIVAYLRAGVPAASMSTLKSLDRLESALLGLLREAFDDDAGTQLNLSVLAQRLKDGGADFSDILPQRISQLLETLRQDGRELPGGCGSLGLRRLDKQTCQVALQRPWDEIESLSRLRRACAMIVLSAFMARLPQGARGKDLEVDLTLGQIARELKSDLAINAELRDVPAAVQSSLLYLHEQGVLTLAQGLSVFRSAMTLRLYPEERKRGFASHDYQPLADHYAQRVSQIHVMIRYAETGMNNMSDAMNLARDYFASAEQAFLANYFPQHREMLERATTEASWHRIIDGLSPLQRRIVTEKRPQNRLVLAGPGSGKTRLIVHRVAFLVRVLRERPESILVVTFNRHAAAEIRRRLSELIDNDAVRVMVHTYHGLARRLTGTPIVCRDQDAPPDFEQMLVDATRLLKGETVADWETSDTLRDRLLAGSRWLLVDEYQDINGSQYDFLSALAGRTLQDGEGKLNLLAVGDDDQNIYEFVGAEVEFIRRFEQDYGSKVDYLVENFRSTADIIAAANAMIDIHPARLKTQHPVCINADRRKLAPGGAWSVTDAAAGAGRVQVLNSGADYKEQGWLALLELRRMAALDAGWDWSRVAIIAREWRALASVQAGCELFGISCCIRGRRERVPPVLRQREVAHFLARLDECRDELMSLSQLLSCAGELPAEETDTTASRHISDFIDDFSLSAGDGAHPVPVILDAAYEFLADASRSRGDGLCLVTAHGAKGLEFDHVVVLDGAWRTQGVEAMAERRLYYVAMTRARQTLALCRMTGASFADELASMPAVLLRSQVLSRPLPEELSRCFELLGMGEVDMDFAGRSPDESVRVAIAQLKVGDELLIEALPGQTRWAIRTLSGKIIGRTAQRYTLPAGKLLTARVAFICARRRRDVAAEWQYLMRHEQWEVVLPELVLINA